MKKIVTTIIILGSIVVRASSGEHGGEEGVPWSQIGWQAANLGILLTALFFFIKKSIVDAFKARQTDYVERAEKTKSALKDAESALAGIKEKLAALETGEGKSLEKAKHEADILKANIVKEAEESAEKIKKDAVLTINNELTKAKSEINGAILNKAISITTKTLTEKNQASASAQEAAFVKQLEQVKA